MTWSSADVPSMFLRHITFCPRIYQCCKLVWSPLRGVFPLLLLLLSFASVAIYIALVSNIAFTCSFSLVPLLLVFDYVAVDVTLSCITLIWLSVGSTITSPFTQFYYYLFLLLLFLGRPVILVN